MNQQVFHHGVKIAGPILTDRGISALITTPTAHGLTVSDENKPICQLSDGSYALAKADSINTLSYVGMLEEVIDTTSFKVIKTGLYPWTSHGYAKGTVLYVSSVTAGAIATATPGSAAYGCFTMRIGIAHDVNNILLDAGTPIEIVEMPVIEPTDPVINRSKIVQFTVDDLSANILTITDVPYQPVPVTINASGETVSPVYTYNSSTSTLTADFSSVTVGTGETWKVIVVSISTVRAFTDTDVNDTTGIVTFDNVSSYATVAIWNNNGEFVSPTTISHNLSTKVLSVELGITSITGTWTAAITEVNNNCALVRDITDLSANTTISSSYAEKSIRANTTAGDLVLTFAAMTYLDDGKRFSFINSDSNKLSIACANGQLMWDSETQIYTETAFASITLEYVHSLNKFVVINAYGTWTTISPT